ncbi:MAG: alpha-L-fucosidase [Bacteroidota bacterium]|nr:alpha-L-fucosidase [Bacteroidota bacterium]
MKKLIIVCTSLVFFASMVFSQEIVTPPKPLPPLPSASQIAWHEMEMNAFVHFTTNTFTGLEWGMGGESMGIFYPTRPDVNQWIKTLKETGFKGVILTCKHHDGFCLWPSKYTEHSIKNSPYKNGQGDLVKEVSDACRQQGVKFGIYCSPWDRNNENYGNPKYITYYRNQLKELFTNYGPIFEMWFDGANGGSGFYGGANETRKIDRQVYYDWPGTIKMVRSIQPNVVFFSDAGPDIRWVGNEEGRVGETNWDIINPDTLYAGKSGIEKLLNTGSEDGTHWIPAEVDVSIRPGWFYHSREDSLVKSPQRLFEIYLSSVGRGSNLLLNVPPDRRGLINENDLKALKGFRELLENEFKTNLTANAKVITSSYRGNSSMYNGEKTIDSDKETYWATDDNIRSGSIEIDFSQRHVVKYVLLQEYIKLGQRVKNFNIEINNEANQWVKAAEGTTIGYKRIIKLAPVMTDKIKINILDAKASLVISNIDVY